MQKARPTRSAPVSPRSGLDHQKWQPTHGSPKHLKANQGTQTRHESCTVAASELYDGARKLGQDRPNTVAKRRSPVGTRQDGRVARGTATHSGQTTDREMPLKTQSSASRDRENPAAAATRR